MPTDEIQREVISTERQPSEATAVMNILLVFLAFLLFAVVVYYVSVSLPSQVNMPNSVTTSGMRRAQAFPQEVIGGKTTPGLKGALPGADAQPASPVSGRPSQGTARK